MFDDFLGFNSRSRSRTRVRKGSDLRCDLKIGFLDAAFGMEKEVEVPKVKACQACSGSGVEPGFQNETCPSCGGSGQIVRSQGSFRVATMCPNCRGAGEVITYPCNECRGTGQVQVIKKISVRELPKNNLRILFALLPAF